ncbi:sodium-dependent transporter [Adlercreutzia shanghongiae]|uniref:Sodium-dependent transporter n=1 Tax=Adlercreutzia shanghongiae TaxID=3111773 RepID=A0ABU6IZ65_9ACTN|nr:sodium-dependent transporter [Adlercreutzia sp. R22]MEC4295167.1 sodium-dependent transporter [Adlercreutzia sp. R22]
MAPKNDNFAAEEARAIEIGEETGGGATGKKRRDTWTTRTGFILACVGSAVGMANIWLFPYRVAQLGGAAFLIPYLIFVALIGFSGVIGEMSFGRAMGTGPMGAFAKAVEMRKAGGGIIGKLIGLIPTLGSLAIAIGYAVVLGWACNYLVASIDGGLMAQTDMGAFFGAIASDFGNVGFHLLGLAITFGIMILGVSRGIEKVNKVLMPTFFVLFVIIAIRVATLPGAAAGYEYLLVPRWEALLNPTTWVYALGQAFFSLSLAGCGTLVYGSYLKKDVDTVSAARNVAIFDTLAGLVAACVVVPAVFAFGLDVSSGPPLLFITLAQVFQEMPFGNIFAVILFISVVFAAITSLMNLFEAPVEALQEQLHLSRAASVGLVAIAAVAVGLFLEGGSTVSLWMDVVSIYVMPVGALLAAIMFFWVCPKGFAKSQAELGHGKPLGPWFNFMTRYVFVGITAAVIVLGIFYGGIG